MATRSSLFQSAALRDLTVTVVQKLGLVTQAAEPPCQRNECWRGANNPRLQGFWYSSGTVL